MNANYVIGATGLFAISAIKFRNIHLVSAYYITYTISWAIISVMQCLLCGFRPGRLLTARGGSGSSAPWLTGHLLALDS